VGTSDARQGRDDLGKILVFLGATIGGAAGWWIGAHFGFMTAFFVSIVGTAAGIYIARRWLRGLLP
jgi:cadmium resistance protein CadD (predicted permease)